MIPHQTRFVLGDLHCNAPNVARACRLRNLFLVTTQYGSYSYKDDGAKVRSVFHKLGCTPHLPNWTGAEWRPGSADLRWQVLERDGDRCRLSGRPVTPATAHVDHIKPRSRFSRPEQADCLENLQTLHVEVHQGV